MSLDAMKLALEALEEIADEVFAPYDNKLGDAILALRAAIEQAQEPETELETYKRLYELRGKALERPCSNCGHQPAKIKAMAQPEQEPVAWILEWIEDGEVYASKLYESERRCRYDAKKDTNAVCRPLVYGDKLKEKNNG